MMQESWDQRSQITAVGQVRTREWWCDTVLSAWLHTNLSILTFSLGQSHLCRCSPASALHLQHPPWPLGKAACPLYIGHGFSEAAGFKFRSASAFHAACSLVGVLVLFPVPQTISSSDLGEIFRLT